MAVNIDGRSHWNSVMHMKPLRRPVYERASSSAYGIYEEPRQSSMGSGGDSIDYAKAYATDNLQNVPILGQATTVTILDWKDVAALVVTFTLMGCAIVTVRVPGVAWRLGLPNQLKIIGFLLSGMNLCLMAILPTFLLRCEAALGRSTIQNLEAIFSNQALRSHVDWRWRSAIFLLLALPPGLGVSYKEFFGGYAITNVAGNDDLYNGEWGLYAPTGLLPLGYNTGTILMYNASTPFMKASTNSAANAKIKDYNNPANDVPFPSYLPQAYGFNTLLLNSSAAALLDAPPPDWVGNVQRQLQLNEAWNVSATVLATVSAVNTSIEAHRAEPLNSSFWSPNFGNDGNTRWRPRLDGWSIGFSSNMLGYGQDMQGSSDSSWCFVALKPPGGTVQASAQMWSTVRKACRGTWRITRTDISLISGDCDDSRDVTLSMPHQQAILRDNTLDLSDAYSVIIEEFVAQFMSARNHSLWLMPTMATTVATMYWSRNAAVSGPGSPHWPGNDTYHAFKSDTTYHHAGLQYASDSVIYSSREAMRTSGWLYVVLAIQPVLTISATFASMLLRHVPIGKGFGIISVLGGIRPESVPLLRGAGYSGTLTRAARLVISIQDKGSRKPLYTTYEIDPQQGEDLSRPDRTYG